MFRGGGRTYGCQDTAEFTQLPQAVVVVVPWVMIHGMQAAEIPALMLGASGHENIFADESK